jgi:hypothetical protein
MRPLPSRNNQREALRQSVRPPSPYGDGKPSKGCRRSRWKGVASGLGLGRPGERPVAAWARGCPERETADISMLALAVRYDQECTSVTICAQRYP